jgi:hypothetical protein
MLELKTNITNITNEEKLENLRGVTLTKTLPPEIYYAFLLG